MQSSQDYDTGGTPLISNVTGNKLVSQFSRLSVTGFRTEGGNATMPPVTLARLEAMSLIVRWPGAFPNL